MNWKIIAVNVLVVVAGIFIYDKFVAKKTA